MEENINMLLQTKSEKQEHRQTVSGGMVEKIKPRKETLWANLNVMLGKLQYKNSNSGKINYKEVPL